MGSKGRRTRGTTWLPTARFSNFTAHRVHGFGCFGFCTQSEFLACGRCCQLMWVHSFPSKGPERRAGSLFLYLLCFLVPRKWGRPRSLQPEQHAVAVLWRGRIHLGPENFQSLPLTPEQGPAACCRMRPRAQRF